MTVPIVPDINIDSLRYVLEEKVNSRKALYLPKIVAFPDRYWVNNKMNRVRLIRLDFLCQEYTFVKGESGIEGFILQYILTKEHVSRDWTVYNEEHFSRNSPGYKMEVLYRDIIVTILNRKGKRLKNVKGTIMNPTTVPSTVEEVMPVLNERAAKRIIRNFNEVVNDGNEFVL